MLLLIAALSQGPTLLPPGDTTAPIRVGLEYVLLDRPGRIRVQAQALAPIGLSAVKQYAEQVEWGEMQKGPGAAIDFRRQDGYVREFQATGVAEVVICLRSASAWASRGYRKIGALTDWMHTGPLHRRRPSP